MVTFPIPSLLGGVSSFSLANAYFELRQYTNYLLYYYTTSITNLYSGLVHTLYAPYAEPMYRPKPATYPRPLKAKSIPTLHNTLLLSTTTSSRYY